MPPDYNELPIPKKENVEKETNDIKSLISKTNNNETKENLDKKNSTFDSLILEKIKNN